MPDHQLFEETILPNGIRVYTYQDTFPVACVEIQLPVGSAHATEKNGFFPGSPHFLEHTQLLRSKTYPNAYQLDRLLGLKAGSSNAATHASRTTHWIDIPDGEQEFAYSALIDRIFHPLFQESDLVIERSVVRNERDKQKFYPAKSEASQYLFTQFLHTELFPLEQVFGSNDHLEALTAEYLASMHRSVTQNEDVVVLAVGNGHFEALKEQLSQLPTQKKTFVSTTQAGKWSQKTFHIQSFEEITTPRLEVAWLHRRPTYQEYRSICFFVSLLINSTEGALYQELREEKGWAYSLSGFCQLQMDNLVISLSFPVNTLEQVTFIRDVLADRITTAAANQELVDQEISRQLGNQVYYYQTAGSIINGASNDILLFDRIYTEAEYRQAVETMRDPAWRNHIIQTFFAPHDMGSVCFLPK